MSVSRPFRCLHFRHLVNPFVQIIDLRFKVSDPYFIRLDRTASLLNIVDGIEFLRHGHESRFQAINPNPTLFKVEAQL